MSSSEAMIHHCSVLNIDKTKSTILPINIFTNKSPHSYIVSDCDEELLVLIEFKKNIKLRSITLHAKKQSVEHESNNDEQDDLDISAPKLVLLYKTKHLNIDFDDIESMKPDKTVDCSTDNLHRGQTIKLIKDIQFKSVKYLVIYIKSNQNDTEATYFNGISFNNIKTKHVQSQKANIQNRTKSQLNKAIAIIDNMNAMGMDDLEILAILKATHEKMQEKVNETDSLSLHNKCQLSQCAALKRICMIIREYHEYIKDQKKKEFIIADIFGNDIDYDNTNLLNDFNHLLFDHCSDDGFEQVYNVLITETNNSSSCRLSECLLLQRNHRDRASLRNDMKTMHHLYGSTNDIEIVKQQILDRIHSYFFHTFDIGHKLTQKDKQNILHEQHNEHIEDMKMNENMVHDLNVININKYITQKRNKYAAIDSLNRIINNENNKFVFEEPEQMNDEDNDNNYSYGYRYYYWKYYKNDLERDDDASQFDNYSQQFSNKNSFIRDWFVEGIYDNFKQEIVSNSICCLSVIEWNQLLQKALGHHKTEYARSIKCARDKTAICYDMKHGAMITINHLISLMIYCNFDILQAKFSETYRKLHKHETLTSMKERHRNYYFLGRLLRECVECFGLKTTTSSKELADGIDKDGYLKPDKRFIVYHGVSKLFEFSSLYAFVKGPFSTSTDYAVAASFCANKGMILGLDIRHNEWSLSANDGFDAINTLSCFDCSWISDYTNEQEIFCIGGVHKFQMNTIILAKKGINYEHYIHGLNQMTNFMTTGDSWDARANVPKTKDEKQIVFRLLSHELYRYYPHHQYSNEFKSCPVYIQKLLHSHCLNVKKIIFENDKQFDLNKFAIKIFKDDNDWIKIYLIMKMFPNMMYIYYNAKKKDESFLQNQFIYGSVLSFIEQNGSAKFTLQIRIHTKYFIQMKSYIQFYKKQFNQYSWDIDCTMNQQSFVDICIWNAKVFKDKARQHLN